MENYFYVNYNFYKFSHISSPLLFFRRNQEQEPNFPSSWSGSKKYFCLLIFAKYSPWLVKCKVYDINRVGGGRPWGTVYQKMVMLLIMIPKWWYKWYLIKHFYICSVATFKWLELCECTRIYTSALINFHINPWFYFAITAKKLADVFCKLLCNFGLIKAIINLHIFVEQKNLGSSE